MTSLCIDDVLVSTETAPVCEYLNWDSGLYGIRIGKVTGNRLDEQRAAEVLQWTRQHSLDCLYFLADMDALTIQTAEQLGFHLVDIRATLEARLLGSYEGKWSSDGVREAVPEDIPVLREIAGQSHSETRFYRDGRFQRHLCDEMYRIWIEKSCRGYADMVMVGEVNSRPAGYITCHLREDGSGQIGLQGVDSRARKLGLGHTLVRHALCWFREYETREVTVVTQGSDTGGQRLYERCGFLNKSTQLWYHWWPSR